MLALDAAGLNAEDGDVNPVAALFRLQRCRRQAELPALAAALFGALRREGLARLSEALMRMLVVRFGGDETNEGSQRNCGARCATWRNRGCWRKRSRGARKRSTRACNSACRRRRQGASLERTLLRRLAAQRFDVATGDGLATLLANEEDVERLAKVGDLVIDCGSAQELLRRGRDMLANGNGH